MNYAVGAAFNLNDIFENFNLKKLEFDCDDALKINNNQHRDVLVKKIFRESLKVILNDIIDNNVTFELPTGRRKSNIYIKRFSNEDFAKGRQNGKWEDVDFLESNFSGYQMVLNYQTANTFKEKPIYLNPELKNKIIENTNKGKQYC